MRVLWSKVPTVAIAAILGVIAGPSFVQAQQQSGTTVGSGTIGGTGSGTTLGGITGGGGGNLLGGAGGQGGNLTGQGVQQPQFRAFGELLNQNTSGFVGGGAADRFVGQQFAGQQNARGGLGPQFGGLGGNPGTTARGTGQTSSRSRAVRQIGRAHV